jgi:predicted phosphodiesterase
MPVKIFYASDLHLESHDYEDYDSPFYLFSDKKMAEIYSKSYLILAGDICQVYEKEKFTMFFDIISCIFKRIIYVSGNHEYHRVAYSDILLKQALFKYSNIYFLQNELIDFPEDGIRFYGVTLWTRLDSNPEYNKIAQNYGSDFKSIMNYTPLEQSYYITRNGTSNLFEKQFKNLKNDLKLKSNLKTIIVTHHTPLIEIIQPWIKKNEIKYKPIATLYASDLKSELVELDFDYWIFGHSHTTYYHELTLNNKKIAQFKSNPYGYFGSNKVFSPECFIEI